MRAAMRSQQEGIAALLLCNGYHVGRRGRKPARSGPELERSTTR